MNTIDIILSIILLLGFVRGLYNGFFVELAGLVALIAGIYGALHFSNSTLEFLQTFISWNEHYLSLLAFALTFIAIVIVVSLIGKILTKVMSLMALGIVNRILGAVFGFLKMAFLASLFFMFLNQSSAYSFGEETRENSILYEPVEGMAPLLLPTILKEIKERELILPSQEKE